MAPDPRPKILLVEDNEADVRMMRELLDECDAGDDLVVARDGEEALTRLRRGGKHATASRPDLILLDLNLPRMSGHEVLAAIKADPDLRRIPVLVLTTSSAEAEINKCYDLHANCYLVKRSGLDEFIEVVESIRNFWLRIARLPYRGG